jgi:hypothetical protein
VENPYLGVGQRARMVMASVVLVAALASSSQVAAQTPDVPKWSPPTSSLGLGCYRVAGDGESSYRLGAAWYPSPRYEVLATTSLWNNYDLVEAEFRVLRSSASTVRPFVSVSGLWQNHGAESLGGTLGGGIEYYAAPRVVLSGTLAWQSLFPLEGQSENQWFRISGGVSIVPPFG